MTIVVGNGGDTLEDILKSIESDKRQRLINAAIEEFALVGFEKASTNKIVKRANVSKGLLYHYFKSKQELYDYICIFVLELVMTRINERFDFTEPDLFKRFTQVAMIKSEIQFEYPYAYDAIPKFYENKTMEELTTLVESFSPNIYQRIYTENVDYSLFKDDVDIEKAMKMIQWTVEKVGEEGLAEIRTNGKMLDFEAYRKKFEAYTDMLKATFYK